MGTISWRGWLIACGLMAGGAIALASQAGRFLILDAPRPADSILVLAGETDRRPKRALELLRQGYGKRIVLDVPTNGKLYGFSQIQLAEKYVEDLKGELPSGVPVIICPIDGLSTKDESKDAAKCLGHEGAKSVLLVTSDFHTRRALDVFRRELPEYDYSIAASRNAEQYGPQWWKHRQWAKIFQEEWLKMIWWKLVDRWR